jgi:transcription elongation factor Elf1
MTHELSPRAINAIDALDAIDAALGALEAAQDSVDNCISILESRKAELRDAGRFYLLAAVNDDDLLHRASYVYWTLPDIPASDIASVVLGNPKAVHKLLAALPKILAPTFSCPRCGADAVMASRAAVALRAKYQREGIEVLCSQCLDTDQESRQTERAERDRIEQARLSALRSMPYRDYLLTEEWLATRNQKLKQAWFKCQLCNTGGLLNVHHRTYERRGCEDMRDLVVLCHPCHAKFHGKMP